MNENADPAPPTAPKKKLILGATYRGARFGGIVGGAIFGIFGFAAGAVDLLLRQASGNSALWDIGILILVVACGALGCAVVGAAVMAAHAALFWRSLGKSAAANQPSLRWYQFSLRSMLLFTVVFALLAGWGGSVLKRGVERRAAIDRITRCGGRVTYDYQSNPEQFVPVDWPTTRQYLGPIIDAYADVSGVDLVHGNAHVSDSDLSFIARLPEVRDLWLGDKGISDSGLKHIARLKKLQSLWLSGGKITDAGLEHLQQLESLGSLTLENTAITMSGLAKTPLGSRLGYLSVDSLTVTDATIAGVETLRNLESLQLRYAVITNKGLASLGNAPKLKSLTLSHCGIITDEGLAELRTIKSLEELTIFGATITDAGIVNFRDLPRLHVLVLAATPHVTESGLLNLQGGNLRELRIDVPLTTEGIGRLRRALPKCSIVFFGGSGPTTDYPPLEDEGK